MSINGDISKFQKETEKLFFQRLANMERELLADYKAAQQQIITKLRVLYSKLSVPGGKSQLFNASQFNRLNNLEQQINQLIKQLNRNIKQAMTKNIKNEFAQGYYSIGYQLETALQVNLRFGLLNADTIAASVANPLNAIKWQTRVGVNSAKLANQIRSEITSGLIQGNGINETARIISKKFGRHFSNDIERIVRTETMRARSWGNLTAHEQAKGFANKAGIDIHRLWLSTLDLRTRDLHVSIDGQREDKSGNFTFDDGVVLTAPRLSGVAEHDIRCRCTTIDIVDNETPKMRLDNEEKKLIPFTKFKDYKAKWINKKKSPIKKPASPLPKGTKLKPTKGNIQNETVKRFEREIKNSDIERSGVFNSAGDLILRSSGNKNSIGFTKSEVKLFEGNVFTHNHPSSSAFSFADIKMFVISKLKEMRAIGKNTMSYSMKYKNISKAPSSDSTRETYLSTMKREFNKQGDAVDDLLRPLINKGNVPEQYMPLLRKLFGEEIVILEKQLGINNIGLTLDYANKLHYSIVWQRVVEKFNLLFEVTRL